jgi:hypothetical protein
MQDILDKLSHTSCTREEKSNLLYNTNTFFSIFVLRGLVSNSDIYNWRKCKSLSCTQNMEAAGSSETLIMFHQNTRCLIPDDSGLQRKLRRISSSVTDVTLRFHSEQEHVKTSCGSLSPETISLELKWP